MAALHVTSPAETAPAVSWKKTLPSECYFTAAAGDSIVCVGKKIFVLSRTGALLSESQALDDTKNVAGNPPLFFLARDRSVVMIKNRCLVKKISLQGEIIWSKSYCDSIPGAMFAGYREEAEGFAYLYGTVNYRTGLVVDLENGGKVLRTADTTLSAFTSLARLKDTLFAVSKRSQDPSLPGCLVAFDKNLGFIKRIIDTGCGSQMIMDNGRILTLNMLAGASLFKRKFSSTADIILKRFSPNGTADTVALFDFGKYEFPLWLQKYRDGFLMVTRSDETMNVGTNYLNYFVTRLDASLKKQWQIRFGTDSSDYMIDIYHRRCFFADGQGTILAIHNDTLFSFKDGSWTGPKNPRSREPEYGAFSGTMVQAFDCRGRMLSECRAAAVANAGRGSRSGIASGLMVLRAGTGSGGETKVIFSP